jgi:hypothetical protein
VLERRDTEPVDLRLLGEMALGAHDRVQEEVDA